MVGIASLSAGQVMPYQYQWPEAGTYDSSATRAGTTDRTILQEDLIFSEKQLRDRDGRATGALRSEMLTKQRIRFHRETAADDVDLPLDQFSGSTGLAVCDARILKPDGTVIDLDTSAFRLGWHEYRHRTGGFNEVAYKGPDIGRDEILELVVVLAFRGRLVLDEMPVKRQHPIGEKNIFLLTPTASLTPLPVRTYNGFPEAVVDTANGYVVKQWRFQDLKASSAGPFNLRMAEGPCFSLGRWHESEYNLVRSFHEKYPYGTYAPRKHWQSFTEHVQQRKKALGTIDRTVLVADILHFLKDSVRMLDDEELPPSTPVGVHFHNRTLSEEQFVVLLRQLFRVIDAPLHMCFTRDRYAGNFSDTLFAEHVNSMLLAFQGDDGSWHFISPNTTGASYLLDEVPYWLAGQQALLIRVGEDNRMDGAPRRIILPTRRHTENQLSEQVLIEFTDDLGSAWATARGSSSGYVRMAMNQEIAPTGYTWPNLPAPISKWNSLDHDSTGLWPNQRQVHRVKRAVPARSIVDDDVEGQLRIDLSDYVYRQVFGPDPNRGSPLALLPYGFVLRQDIIVSVPHEWELRPVPPRTVRNTIGEMEITATQAAPGTVHWNLNLALVNTHLDRTLYGMYEELLQALADRSATSIQLELAASPAASPVSPAAPEVAPR